VIEQPVHRRPAGSLVAQLATVAAGDPAVRPPLGQLQLTTRPAQRPPGIEGLIEQAEQAGLGGRIDTARDPAT
jgi:hypothetical protein